MHDRHGTYYRTRDCVRRTGPGRPLAYLGRLDSQVRFSGIRVELGEVEAVVRESSGLNRVVALGNAGQRKRKLRKERPLYAVIHAIDATSLFNLCAGKGNPAVRDKRAKTTRPLQLA